MSDVRWYLGDASDLDGMSADEIESMTVAEEERDDAYADYLTEAHGTFAIGGIEFDAGRILQECDPIAFQVGIDDMFEEIDMDAITCVEDCDICGDPIDYCLGH